MIIDLEYKNAYVNDDSLVSTTVSATDVFHEWLDSAIHYIDYIEIEKYNTFLCYDPDREVFYLEFCLESGDIGRIYPETLPEYPTDEKPQDIIASLAPENMDTYSVWRIRP